MPHLQVLHVFSAGFVQHLHAISCFSHAVFLLKILPQSAWYLICFIFFISDQVCRRNQGGDYYYQPDNHLPAAVRGFPLLRVLPWPTPVNRVPFVAPGSPAA